MTKEPSQNPKLPEEELPGKVNMPGHRNPPPPPPLKDKDKKDRA